MASYRRRWQRGRLALWRLAVALLRLGLLLALLRHGQLGPVLLLLLLLLRLDGLLYLLLNVALPHGLVRRGRGRG